MPVGAGGLAYFTGVDTLATLQTRRKYVISLPGESLNRLPTVLHTRLDAPSRTRGRLALVSSDQGFEVRLDANDYKKLERSLHGRDMTEVYAILARLADNRTKILVEYGKTGGNVVLREILEQALNESRATETQIWDMVRRVEDSLHAAAMLELSEVSNTIAERSEATAKSLLKLTESANAIAAQAEGTARSLRNATIALVIVTAVLAAATIVLVAATFRLEP